MVLKYLNKRLLFQKKVLIYITLLNSRSYYLNTIRYITKTIEYYLIVVGLDSIQYKILKIQ